MPQKTCCRPFVSIRSLLLIIFVSFGLLFTGCSEADEQEKNEPLADKGKVLQQETRLVVLAAADLTGAFTEIGKSFEEATGVKPVFSFGSSGQLSEGIINGGKADVFASASKEYVDNVVNKQLGIQETRQVYAYGKIVIWMGDSPSAPISQLSDLLDPRVKKVAIANPDHAPYGVAAKEALEKAGIWDEVQPKIVMGENAKQTLSFVDTGNVEAGIVPLSLVITATGEKIEISEDDHTPIEQTLVVLSSTKNEKAARLFADFVAGPEGQKILSKYGFKDPNGNSTTEVS